MTQPDDRDEQDGEPEPTEQAGGLVPDRLDQRVAGVDADDHQHEEEQHHDGAGVGDDLN